MENRRVEEIKITELAVKINYISLLTVEKGKPSMPFASVCPIIIIIIISVLQSYTSDNGKFVKSIFSNPTLMIFPFRF